MSDQASDPNNTPNFDRRSDLSSSSADAPPAAPSRFARVGGAARAALRPRPRARHAPPRCARAAPALPPHAALSRVSRSRISAPLAFARLSRSIPRTSRVRSFLAVGSPPLSRSLVSRGPHPTHFSRSPLARGPIAAHLALELVAVRLEARVHDRVGDSRCEGRHSGRATSPLDPTSKRSTTACSALPPASSVAAALAPAASSCSTYAVEMTRVIRKSSLNNSEEPSYRGWARAARPARAAIDGLGARQEDRAHLTRSRARK